MLIICCGAHLRALTCWYTYIYSTQPGSTTLLDIRTQRYTVVKEAGTPPVCMSLFTRILFQETIPPFEIEINKLLVS